LNLATRKYYSLSETGAKVWALLAEGTDADAIASALCEEYEVTPEDAARSVTDLLSELRAHGLVEDRTGPT
jgi:PqqD family protein of HPr-rel-A system